MKRTIIIILSLLTLLTVNAQVRQISNRNNSNNTNREGVRDTPSASSSSRHSSTSGNSRNRNPQKPSASKKEKQDTTTPDTVYSYMTKKQYGWFEPLGIITKEQASHCNSSYRFTNRNAQGHWCKMEVIDGYGHYTTTGNFSPYILKLNAPDSLANQDWADKVKTSCIYEAIPDPLGEKVIQERAYDEKMNVLYIFSRTPIGKNNDGRQQYVCSYKDCYGLPAEMRKDTTGTYTYGTLVLLTEDQWGNDSIIQYMDAKGQKKLNSEGVPMEIYLYNKEGHYLKQMSCNEEGERMIDNWGNCGLEYTWNEDHTLASVMYMDADWKPMKMPMLRDESNRAQVTKIIYEYDEYKRNIEEKYVDSDGNPDVNKYGVHKYKITYDDNGNITGYRTFNRKGNLTPSNESQIAEMQQTYTKDGKIEEVILLDKNEQPCSTPGYLSRIHYEYDDQGKQILVERFEMVNGKELLASKEFNSDTYEYVLYNDGSYRVDSLDLKGRNVYTGWFDKDGKLEMYNGRAYERTVYMDEGSKTISILTEYDQDGNPTENENGICKYINIVDSLNLTKKQYRYNLKNELIDCFIHQHEKDFNTDIVAQYDTNAFGMVARCGGTPDVRYYKADVLYKPTGYSSLIGKDEFDEPDYIVTPSMIYYYMRMTKEDNVTYDEDNQVISDYDELKDKLPKVMSIEVIDSAAYRLGIRDNDLILLYGDYYNDLEQTSSYNDFRSYWTIRNVLDGEKTRRMVVFRIDDAKNNQYGLVEIEGLKGSPSELGFITHIRYLTDKQKTRVMQAIHDNAASNHPLITSSDKNKVDWKGDNIIVIAYNELFRSDRNKPYARQITDPAIHLGTCVKDWEMAWSLPQSDHENLTNILELRRKKLPIQSPINFYFTKDSEKIITLTTNENLIGVNLYGENVSDEIYNKFLTLSQQAEKEMEKEMAEPSKFTTKNLYGRWEIDNKVLDNSSPIGYLQLAKDGTCEGTISQNGIFKLRECNYVFRVDRDYTGRWTRQGSLVIFSPENNDNDNETIICTDVIGVAPSEKESAISSMNELYKEFKSVIRKKMFFFQDLDDVLVIKSLDKKSLVLEEKDGDGIRLVKTKSTKAQK